MSTLPPPNSREVQEFQFKLLARLRLFEEQQAPPLKQPLSLVVAASKYGLICVGTSTGFDVVETAKIVEHCVGARKPTTEVTNFPRRRVVLGAQPSHLDLSCDSQHLAVGYSTAGGTVVRIYDVTSFTTQVERVVSEVRLPAPIQALSWNPGIPNLLATCLQNGSVFVYEFKNNSFDISSIPPEAQATCLCWSPKGKQIVIGCRNGTLNQFKPDLKIVKAIPPPQNGVSVASVRWLSNMQYAAVYTANGTGLSLVLVNTPRNQPITYINYDDITYSNGNNRLPEFYFIHQETWNVLLVGSSNSMEVGVLGLQGSDWEQWTQEDAARAELPLSASKQDTHPVGMALDTSVQYNIPWGENQQLPCMPLLLLLSHEGLLSLYWSLNLMHGAATICTPPTPLPDTSGLYLFSSPEAPPAVKPLPPPQAEVSPQPQIAAVVPQPVQPTAAPVTPQPVWSQGSPLAAPKPTIGTTQGSWMMPSSTPNTFLSSPAMQPPPPPPPALAAPLTTAAFSSASTVAPTQPFNISSSTAPTPFSFTSQAPELVSKPGGFTTPSQPIAVNAPPTQLAVAPVLSVPEKVDIPEVPALPPSSVTPEPEIGEESQELKAMNDALIEDAIREEISHFSQEMNQLKQRCQNMSMRIPVIHDAALDKLSEGIHDWTEFVREVADTTKVQAYEVNSLRNFLLDVFTYVENMKTRLHLQNNPDYLSLQSPDMRDPVLARKIEDMKSNLQFIESQLINVDSKLCSKWNMFQEWNKENREAMHIPSLEAIYQAMVMHNNVLMRQKSVVEDLERKMKARHRGKLMSMLNISRMVDSQTENQDSEFSKILQDLLSLSVDNSKINTTELEESLSNMLVSNTPSENLSNVQGDSNLDRMEVLQQIFADNTVKNLDYSLKWSSPRQNTVLPIVSASPRSGSISSGQPVTKTSIVETVQNTATKEIQKNLLNGTIRSTGLSKPKSPFSVAASSVDLGLEKNHSTDVPTLGVASDPKTSLLSSKKVISSSTHSSVPSTVVVTQTSAPSLFNFSSATPSSISTAPQFFVPATTSAPKEFSFAPLPSSQAAFSSSSFGHNIQFPQASNKPFVTTSSKGFGFSLSTTTSTAKSVINTSNVSTEVAKSSPSLNSSFKTTTAENLSNNIVLEAKLPENSSPLASLSYLVSGIEPLKPCNDQIDSPIKNIQPTVGPVNETKNPSQPFVFRIPSSNENKTSSESDQSSFSQNVQNVFSSAIQSNSVLSESGAIVANSAKDSTDELQIKFSGAFKKLNFESALEKSIFGGNASLNPRETESVIQELKPNTVFPVSSPSSSNLFGTSSESTLSQTSVCSTSSSASSLIPKDHSSKPGEPSESVSPIIEVSLKSSKNELDSKLSLEKLSTKRDIVITKVDSVEKNSSIGEEGKLKELEKSSSFCNTFNTSSLTTPTKPYQNIFGGPSLEKQLPAYEIEKLEAQNVATVDKKEEPKAEDLSKPKEATKTPSIFGGSTVNKSGPETSFSFSTSSLLSSSTQPESNKSNQTLSFSFGSNLSTTTASSSSSSNTLNTQVTSSFSVSQIGTQPSSSAFSFTIPTTNESTTTTSTFGFGNISTESSSDDKSKTGFSFGQIKTVVPEGNIFGGFSNKPETTSSIFGSQSTAETKSIFGGQTTTAETKSIFGGQTTTAETKSIFGGLTTTAETKNVFGQTPVISTAITETKSIFGQTSATENKNIFGQPSTTTADTKSIFGQTSAPTSESKSVFGQSSALDTKNVFGQPLSAMSENTNIFGQAVATTSNPQSGFSFSLNATTSAQPSFFGSPATTATSFFGQSICSPATASSPFGQTNTTSVFGNASQTPFGGGASTFGQSGGSFFGQTSGSFSSTSGSVFGGGASSPFGGSSSQPPPAFGQSPGASGGSMFGGGSFSTGGQSVAQTGFGTPGFQNKPAFGASSPPAFGAAPAFGASPTFGGSASFGSPPKLFGSPTPASSSFGSSTQQQSSNFENLANQNTMTFGNLAQNQSPGFGSVFSTQASSPAPSFPPATSGSVFGGSSFSSWR